MRLLGSDEAGGFAASKNMDDIEHIVFHDSRAGATAVAPRPGERPAHPSVLPLNRIRRPTAPAPIDPQIADFCRSVLSRGGLDAQAYRLEPLARRFPACLRALKTPSLCAARTAVERDPRQFRVALNALLIGVTWFYRDPGVIEALQGSLPTLTADRSRGLRVWSAGCSDGAELFTVAMMLAELGRLDGATLLGTDCRAEAVRHAATGRYAAERLEYLPDVWRERYLRPERGHWVVDERLRRAASWRVDDLCEPDDSHETYDLVLCRNVTIYLTPAAASRVWSKLMERLNPGGLLVIGKAERLGREMPLLRLGPCLYRRQ